MMWLYLYNLFGILLLEGYRMTNYFWVNIYIIAKQKYLSNDIAVDPKRSS